MARFAIRCAGFKHDTTRGAIAAFCQRRRAMCRQRCVWGGGHFIRASDDGHDATRCVVWCNSYLMLQRALTWHSARWKTGKTRP